MHAADRAARESRPHPRRLQRVQSDARRGRPHHAVRLSADDLDVARQRRVVSYESCSFDADVRPVASRANFAASVQRVRCFSLIIRVRRFLITQAASVCMKTEIQWRRARVGRLLGGSAMTATFQRDVQLTACYNSNPIGTGRCDNIHSTPVAL